MQLQTASQHGTSRHSKLSLSIASNADELREAQRLRYKVFVETMGLANLANHEGLEQDEFDAYCDHLLVRDAQTLEVVGTYRVLSPEGARKIGRFYSEQEFDLGRLANIRGRIAEAGRACIHPDYRGSTVLMLLWSGLGACMKKTGSDYLIGCASVSLADGGHHATALCHALREQYLAPGEYHVSPLLPYPLQERGNAQSPEIPPLIKGYLRSGAWVCGDPSWDPDFHCADFFMMLPLSKLEDRYARRYLKPA